ncbi:PucR family transcriptional regulator [Metabacillus indicus]|uniref:PucR family transcriptional regulator n=1 Tax=Metabacillus indicus TaxID=246786 RepID=UPI003CEC9B1B
MIEKLAAHYKDAFSLAFSHEKKGYNWYKTDEGQVFGILSEAVTEEEKNLLTTLYTPYDPGIGEHSERSLKWLHYLYGDGGPPFPPSADAVRCYYFFSRQPVSDRQSFEEAMQGSIPSSVILWISQHKGIIFEDHPEPVIDKESIDQWIDSFTSDFFIELYVCIGQLNKLDAGVKERIQSEQAGFEVICQSFRIKQCITFSEALPVFFLNGSVTDQLFSEFLTESLTDTELVQTLKVYFECNLNVSLTAKKLYMHRNSVQYRIDKFIEKTGLDVKHFHEAAAVSLMMKYIEQMAD